MEWIEITDATVEAAKDKALDYLGVDEAQAEFEILEEPGSRLLGLKRTPARVRARIMPTAPRPKAERGDRRRRRGGDEAKPRSDSQPRAPRPAGGQSDGGARRPTSPSSTNRESDDAQQSDRGSDSRSGGGRNQRSRQRGGRDRSAESTSAPAPDLNDPEVRKAMEEATERQLDAAEDFLDGLLDAFDLDADIERVEQEDDATEFRIQGADLGLLVGAGGGTLDALQELTRLAARRRTNGDGDARIRVDAGGYREKRRAALTRFVQKIAEEVVGTGVARALEPMSPPDRKSVHDAINEVDGVRTISEGEEPRRRVVIVPD